MMYSYPHSVRSAFHRMCEVWRRRYLGDGFTSISAIRVNSWWISAIQFTRVRYQVGVVLSVPFRLMIYPLSRIRFHLFGCGIISGGVAKLAGALASSTSTERCKGSNPFSATRHKYPLPIEVVISCLRYRYFQISLLTITLDTCVTNDMMWRHHS